MSPLSHLRSLLISVVNAGLVNDEQELFDLLTTHRAALSKLLDFGLPNEAERKELQGGKMTLEKIEFTINNNLATQVVFLAQTLECSERHVASLVHYVMTTQPNLAPMELLEAVILEHHQRRRDIVECIQYLLNVCLICNTPDHIGDRTHTHAQVDLFVERHILPSIGSKLWGSIEKLEQETSRAQSAVQNAGSETSIQGNATRLGQPVLSARLQSLQVERRILAFNLYLVSCLGHLTVSDLEKIVPWLQQSPRHPLTYHVLTTLLTLFDAVDPTSPGASLRHKLAVNPATVKLMRTRLSSATEWKDQGLRAVILLKWPLFITEILRREPTLERTDGFQADQLEENVWTAIEGGAFEYLASAVAYLQRKESKLPITYTPSSTQLEVETLPEPPSDDFKPAILQSFDTLVRLLIRHASSVVKKIKLRQEDHAFATAPNRSRMFRSTASRSDPPSSHTPPPRHDIAKFVAFIGYLYTTLPPERALQFWGAGLPEGSRQSYLEASEASSASSGKLSSFLQWVVWSTRPEDVDMCIALYKMLAGLANGEMCSELALNFLGRNTGEVAAGNAMPGRQETVASWKRMAAQFEIWITPVPATRPTPQAPPSSGFMSSNQFHSQPQQPTPMSLKEMELGQVYLRLIEVIAKHSAPCRIALAVDPRFRILPTLVSIIPLGRAFGIPLELKGSVFKTLAALCGAGAGSHGVEICRQMWGMLERIDVINVRSGGMIAKKGVQDDLERVEEPSGMYPAAIPFLSLLSALIHTPKQFSLRSRINQDEAINTVPETLGQPYRQPGIQPYIAFVVDEVFLRIPNREYQVPRERWLMNECCLSFMERCLASYDLESFLSAAEANQIRPEDLPSLTSHPGYDLLQRLLTSSPLQMSILGYIVDGVDGFDKRLNEEEPLFTLVITRVLRIVHRVLEIQDIFLDVLVPLLLELRDIPVSGQIHPRSYYIGFDAAISFGSSYAPAISAYVTFVSTRAELGILSVKILSILAKSSAFTNLTTLIERSNESERIADGYRQILEVESLDPPSVAEEDAERFTGAGAPDVEDDDIPSTLVQAARLSILSLLSQNTTPESAYPNIAHLILFGTTAQTPVQDPRAMGARRVGIHAILDEVDAGVPRLDRSSRAIEHLSAQPLHPLFTMLPELAERFYRVLYNLCLHGQTSEPTMRYLRLNEDFFARHLAAIPFQTPSAPSPTIEVRYPDGARVTTTVAAFTAFLRLRSYVFDLVALDLHGITQRGDRKAVGALLEIIYGNEAHYSDTEWEDEVFGRAAFRERGQSSMRAVEYAQSLSFDWISDIGVAPQSLEFLAGVNLAACLRTDDKGCEIVDRDVLLVLLAQAQRAVQARGRITTQVDLDHLAMEKRYILESAIVENQRREVAFARAKGFEAWRRMVEMTLVKAGEQLPRAARETVLSDLLDELPPILRSDLLEQPTAVLLAEVALALVAKLREERVRQRVVAPDAGSASGLSAERIHALLRNVVECVLEHRAELVRGNLYAALINYFHLVAPAGQEPSATESSTLALSLRPSSLSSSLSVSTRQSQATFGLSTSASTDDARLSVLKPFMDRLVAAVARDASDGAEVWRTVAFMLLDGLVRLSHGDALNVLYRRGFLSSFVKDTQDADRWLLAVLKPDPDDLNALYVYEAKMSLLVRVAQTRAGAERLLDARVIPTLAECDFIDAQPEADQAFIDKGGFLPSAIQRYHQMLLPALQLVNAVLATLGQGHTTASAQTLAFLNAHRDTIAILLKNDADEIPLAVLDEVYLLATLCGAVLPKVERHELMSTNTGFGSIHSALLSLAAKSFGGDTLARRVRPQSEAEESDARVNAPGYAHQSKFDILVQDTEQLLRKALIAYAGTASEFTESDIVLVLSPVMSSSRQPDASSRLIATVPTVSDALDALNALVDTLGEQLKHITNIGAELSAKDLIRVEDVQEILPLPEQALLDELDVGQKRALICAELVRIQNAFKTRAKVVLSSLEMLLLLVWRHAAYYAESRHTTDPSSIRAAAPGILRALQASMTGSTSGKGDVDIAAFARRAGPVIAKVGALETELDRAWHTGGAYVRVLAAKLREALGIPAENDGR